MYIQKVAALLLFAILWLSLPGPLLSQNVTNPFSFTLNTSAKTSAGIYNAEGTLIRTLWSGINYHSGTYSIKWDGTNDSGKIVSTGDYTAKVLSNNVSYQWEGVIGNTSDSVTGSTKYHSYDIISSMTIAGNKAFCGAGYNEGNTSEFRFNLSTPQQKTLILPLDHSTSQTSNFNATDGINVYWAGNDPFSGATYFLFGTKSDDDTETSFAYGSSLKMTYGRNYQSVIDYQNNQKAAITGLAVQKNHDFLFVSHKDLNEIHVMNKKTGQVVRKLPVTSPGGLSVDADDNLWIINSNNTVSKHIVNVDGSLSTSLFTLAGVVSPIALAISPDNAAVVVCDAGTSQQLKAYSNVDARLLWTYGKAGGYATDPVVNNDKFYFSDLTNDIRNTFICFQPDGSFWVSDPGNYRVQHFTANRTFIDRIMYLPSNYSVQVDQNNPTRVFAQYLEFRVDYLKPLAANNGSWTLVKNWRGSITSDNYVGFITDVFKCVKTLSNGRTYGLIKKSSTGFLTLVELPATGPFRLTGIDFQYYETLNADGSVTNVASSNNELTFTKKVLSGFDGLNNPVWESPVILAVTHINNGDPEYGGAYSIPIAITSSSVILSFNSNKPPNGSSGYHLGGIKAGDNKWLWKTALSTNADYKGVFPSNGDFDIGNDVQYAGNAAMAIDRSIFWGYNGEFWKASQTNKWNHVYDDGLFIGQFGVTGPEVQKQEGPAMMAGNAFSPSIVKVGDDYYLYHNDESYHSGVHRWKITGLNTIQEQSIPLTNAFQRMEELPVLPGIDLMEGLPFDSVLQNNTRGWTRYPTTEDYTSYNQYWSVKTNVKSYSKRKSPDLSITYATKTGPYLVSRDLGTNLNLPSWKVTGQISYEGNMPNTDNISMYLDILDNAGKVIVRFYTKIEFNPSVISIVANNTVIAKGDENIIKATTDQLQPFAISMSNGVITVIYANYAPVIISSFDPSGNIVIPKTMQLRFDYTPTGANYGKVIDLDAFRFWVPKSNNYFRTRSSGDWNNFSTWQSSADSITWISAVTIPNDSANTIIIQNGHTVTLTDSVKVDQLTIQDGGVFNVAPNALLIVNDGPGDDIIVAPLGSLVIQSDSTGTGRIGNSSGTISGNVTVEEYFTSLNNPSYQLLSPTVNTINSTKPFIRDNWQEGQNNTTTNNNSDLVKHYGTHITGSTTGANGFDATQSGSPSLFTYNQIAASPDWTPAANTNAASLVAKKGYLVYISGDRSTSLSTDGSSSNTTLRAKGNVLSGTQAFTGQEGNGRMSLVANPYPCPVDWKSIYNDTSTSNAQNFQKYYTYWDQAVGTGGGYVTVGTNGIKSASTNMPVKIQSNQAFFIRTKPGIVSPTFMVKENHKSKISKSDTIAAIPGDKFMTTLYFTDKNGKRIMADAVNTVFDNASSANVDEDDAEEMSNWDENIAILRNGKILCIEKRPSIKVTDTLPLLIQRLKVQNYEWQFNPTVFSNPILKSFLDDNFLKNYTPISLTSITKIPFSVSNIAASSGRNRFKIIFASSMVSPYVVANAGADKTIALPVSSTSLSGSGTDSNGAIISSYKWVQVSGPNAAVFSSSAIAAPTVSGLIAGIYVFSLVVTDDKQFFSVSDEVTITVNSAPANGTPVYRINAGGGQVTNSIGVFSADAYYSTGATYSTASPIAGTTDDAMYQSERYGNGGTMSYAFPVSNGQYTVVLHFAEIYWTAVGNRIFDVTIEGNKVLDNYDIFKKVGSNTATIESFTTTVTDGMLNINFSSLAIDGGKDWAKISAIEILRNSPGNTFLVSAGIDKTSSTGIAVQKLAATVQPNPSSHYFNFITSGNNKPVDITMFNAIGQLIETKTSIVAGSTLRFGNNYRPGLYYAVIMQGVDKVILKCIKQNDQ